MMRVTQRTMYTKMLNNMQSTLGAYMESNTQGASQKRINRPSDDPAGAALVLNARRNIENSVQYKANVDTAKGWLQLTDGVLQQTSTTLIKIKELAEQASTETYTHENRQQIASQVRELFGNLLHLSNAEFENKSIFAGHKYKESAFDQVLSVTTMDENLQDVDFRVSGLSDKSYMLIFGTDGKVGTDALDYRWSNDNGRTWNEGTLAANENAITMDGVTVTLPNDTEVKAEDQSDPISGKLNGSVLYVHPTARYNGDTQDTQAYGKVRDGQHGLMADITGTPEGNVLFETTGSVDLSQPNAALNYRYSTDGGQNWEYGTAMVENPTDLALRIPLEKVPGVTVTLRAEDRTQPTIPADTAVDIQPRRADIMGGEPELQANVQGSFNSNVLVRMDSTVDMSSPNQILEYAYSTDNGASWVKASTITPDPAADNVRLPLPGGYMVLSAPQGASTTLAAGTQVVVHPDRADLDYEILKDTYISVNSVGKDVFGGLYNGKLALPADENLFEIVGDLITFCEFNNRQGVADTLERLTKAQGRITTYAAEIGGKENRIDLAADIIAMEKEQQTGRLSYTEDIDLTELLTNLSKQELAYNTVLKSSSMIMQMNLTKYL